MSSLELSDLASDLFERRCSWDVVAAAERDGHADDLWDVLQRQGFTDVPIPEACGGSGGTVVDAVDLLCLAGRFAAPVPLAEAGLIAGTLLAAAQVDAQPGLRTVPPPWGADLRIAAGRVHGTAVGVPWGAHCDNLVALIGNQVVVIPGPKVSDAVHVSQSSVNIAGEPRDSLQFEGALVGVRAEVDLGAHGDEFLWELHALGRTALMAGALVRVADITTRYASDREQFGRPLRNFQAVQEHLVIVHQQAAIAQCAVEGAARAVLVGAGSFQIASATIAVHRAARLSSAAAHQAHGAIGMTREYPLQYLTRRLTAWRHEIGGYHRWVDRLGQAMITAGPDSLYAAIQNELRTMA